LVYQIAVGSTRYVITSDTSISDIKPVVTRENNVNISAAATGVPATFNISFYKVGINLLSFNDLLFMFCDLFIFI